MRFKLFSICGLVISLTTGHVRGELGFVLTPNAQSVVGNEAIFSGTLTNRSLSETLFLNDLRITFTNAGTNLLADTNVFFANVPGILFPGESYTDLIFAVTVNDATPGLYSGTAVVAGGTNIFAATDLAIQAFEVDLAAPALSIVLSGTNRLLIWSWPGDGFVLQQNLDLTTSNWLEVTNAPVPTNGQHQVTLSQPDGRMFYRLLHP